MTLSIKEVIPFIIQNYIEFKNEFSKTLDSKIKDYENSSNDFDKNISQVFYQKFHNARKIKLKIKQISLSQIQDEIQQFKTKDLKILFFFCFHIYKFGSNYNLNYPFWNDWMDYDKADLINEKFIFESYNRHSASNKLRLQTSEEVWSIVKSYYDLHTIIRELDYFDWSKIISEIFDINDFRERSRVVFPNNKLINLDEAHSITLKSKKRLNIIKQKLNELQKIELQIELIKSMETDKKFFIFLFKEVNTWGEADKVVKQITSEFKHLF